MLRRELTDVQWERISDLVPGKASDCGSTGRDNRLFVDAVLWIARTSSPWRDLPDAFGNWNSVYVRFSRWAKQGAWERSFQGLGGRSGLRIPDHRFNHCAGTSTCVGRKRGTQNQAIGRSRGGLTSKVHIAVDGLGNPLRFILTGGQVGDVTQAEELIADVAGANLIADTAYDADHLRARLNDAGIVAVIPSNPSRAQAIPYDAELYKERHLVECYITKSNTSGASPRAMKKPQRPTWPCCFLSVPSSGSDNCQQDLVGVGVNRIGKQAPSPKPRQWFRPVLHHSQPKKFYGHRKGFPAYP